MERFPVRDGISIPTREIWTPESHLRDCSNNKNNHHGEWTEKEFSKSILYLMLRNMDVHQEMMQVDIHDWIHREYDPPKLPNPKQVMEEVERGYWEGESIKVRKKGKYVLRLINDQDIILCKNDYNKYK